MKIRFSPLANIAITHGYYSNGYRDITLHPTPQTQALLRAGRTLFRLIDGQLHLMYEVESGNIPISSLADQTLYFDLHPTHPGFANFTAPTFTNPNLTPLYTNRTTPATLDAPQGVILAGGFHIHLPSLSTRPLTLRLKDQAAHLLDTRVITDAASRYDLRHLPSGLYQLEEDDGVSAPHMHAWLIDPDIRDSDAWAVLALRIHAGFYNHAPHFTLALTAREERLRYYIVARNWSESDFNQLQIEDAGFAADGRAQIAFSRIPPPFPNHFIHASLLGDGSAQIVVFQSQTNVVRSERGLKKLNLRRGSTVLIEHLPMPSPERAQAELIIHLSKP